MLSNGRLRAMKKFWKRKYREKDIYFLERPFAKRVV
jgi:hypothetical protein